MGMTHLTEGILPLAGFGGAELNMLVAVKANSNFATLFMSGSILKYFALVQDSKKKAEAVS